MGVPSTTSPLVATHPELDLPDGDRSWAQWLEARSRLETVLWRMADREQPPQPTGRRRSRR
ncbi:MAG: hypothetical protein E6J01_00710 [Chloroflexi bacterium]|nr:MAG: hypothetical protein E6J01_00710 [Chloroflexota bacterium]